MKHHQLTVHRGLDKEVVLEPMKFTWLDYVSWFTFNFKKFKLYMFPFIASGRFSRILPPRPEPPESLWDKPPQFSGI